MIQTNSIHPTAIIYEGAVIGEGTIVGPYSIVGPRVILGSENWIGPHVVIEGHTKIGNKNKFYQFSSIGSAPQDLKYKGEDSVVEIGDTNTIREYVTIQPGTQGGGMLTKIGNSNLLMANTHVGHDCILGNRNILANSAALSGHVTIGNGVIIGGLSGIHQFVRLGDISFVGGGAMVTMDVPPYCTAQGDRAELAGLNKLGLERSGFSEPELKSLKRLYRAIFLKSGILKEKIEQAKSEFNGKKGSQELIDFITSSTRGICLHRKKSHTSFLEE
ncbi:MAG: acyl-ACP--UDP-N-acetylglucosamine O-acyltransferase [bacterium]|nr:acyl-ACP--UDP-N-acetylglucosamine O-acyltransferase [bacterium]